MTDPFHIEQEPDSQHALSKVAKTVLGVPKLMPVAGSGFGC